MAFLIPDNLKSRKDVAKELQRVGSAFQVALDDDVEVWFEPLYDPAGDKPHFVLFFPTRGVVVLEVLDASAKTFLGVFRGKLRVMRDGMEVEQASPLERAERHASAIRDRIEAEQRLRGLGLQVAAGAVFPNLTREEAEQKGIGKLVSPTRCIFKETIDAAFRGDGEAALLRCFVRMLEGAEVDLDEVQRKAVRGILQPSIVVDRITRKEARQNELVLFHPPQGENDDVRVLDRIQVSIATSLGDGHRVIRGVAGSGKTLILTYRARLVAQANPRKTYLVTCYTRALASQLATALGDLPNVHVKHLDGVMSDVIRSARLRHPGFDGDSSGEQVAAVALQALSRVPSQRYDGVFLDEAQDFETAALQFVVHLLRDPDTSDLLVVADAAQNIFRRRFSWKQAGIRAQGRTRILRVNYRNTREILEFAFRFLTAGGLQEDDVPDEEHEATVVRPESARRSGPYPEVRLVPTARDVVSAVVEKARQWLAQGAFPRSIAILYASTRGEVMKSGLIDQLNLHGIDFFWGTDPHNRNAKHEIATATAPIVVSTIHSAKGLEFPRVILCELGRDGDDLETQRKLAYVGMTRATEELFVVTTTHHQLARDLVPSTAATSVA